MAIPTEYPFADSVFGILTTNMIPTQVGRPHFEKEWAGGFREVVGQGVHD